MKVYAVIDTNVLVSALLAKHPDSAPVQILDYLFDRKIIPMYNDEILAEYNEVLRRPKFPFQEDAVVWAINAIIEAGIDSERIPVKETATDPRDVVFLEVAMSRKDSFLVTGNTKHFPVIPRVVTPKEFLRITTKWMNASDHGFTRDSLKKFAKFAEAWDDVDIE